MADRKLTVRIIGDSSSLERAFTRSSKSAKGFSASISGVINPLGGFSRGFLSGAGALSSFGGALALTSGSFFAGAGIVAGLGAATHAAGNLEQAMNVLQQVTRGTNDQISKASKAAVDLGNDISLPATSATDAANAMLQLAKGGLTLQQSLDAARGTLQLAAAAQTDVGTAANTTARALTTFKLSGDQAGAVADALANAANAATGEIGDFAIGLSQSGQSAHAFGLSAQETITALTELAKAGLVGSDAGTSLRVMLARLLPSSKAAQREMQVLGVRVKDAAGNFLPFRDVVNQYTVALAKLPPAQRQAALQTIFGTDAQRAANIVLTTGAKSFDTLAAAISRQGGAAEAAAAQNKGFNGAVDALKSAVSTSATLIGQKLIPSLTTGFRGIATAISELNQGQLDLVEQQVKALGGRIAAALSRELSKAVPALTGFGRRVGQAIGKQLDSINWPSVIARTARALGNALARGLERLDEFVRHANWNKVGAAIATGLGAAVAAAAIFIKNIGVARIGIVLVRLIAIDLPNALGRAAIGFGQKLGQIITNALSRALEAAGIAIEKKAIGIVLKIIEPFTHLPFGIGKPAQLAKEALKRQLADMERTAKEGSRKVAKALEPITKPKAIGARNATAGFGGDGRDVLAPAGTPGPLTAPGGPQRKGLTKQQLNTFFDNEVARILLRGGLGSLNQQIGALDQAEGLITKRIAVTKDITRKLNLEDQLLQLIAQEKDLRQQNAQTVLDGLSLKLDEAKVTATFADDLRILGQIRKEILAEIKQFGDTVELRRQLFENAQEIKQTKTAQISAKDFFALGLGPTGDTRTPLKTTLQRRLGTISDNVKGTFLDTPALEKRLATIRKILADKIVPEDVRSKIDQWFDDINQRLKQGANDVTKFKHVDSNKILSGLGLTGAQARALRARIDQVGAGGTVPPQRSTAFSGAGAGTTTVVVPVNLDGREVARIITPHQQRTARTRTRSRRG